jgi:hypothetical protein
LSLSQNAVAPLLGQGAWRQDVHADTQQLTDLVLDRTEVEQRHVLARLDQQIQIALIAVLAVQHRSKNPCIAGTVALDNPPDLLSMLL